MAITVSGKSPAAASQAIGKALRDLGGPAFGLETGGGPIQISGGLPVYRLGLDDIVGVDSLKRAVKVGWRYIVTPSDGGIGYADVNESAGGAAKFASLARNRNAERLTEAVHLAEKLAPTLPGDYEARILDVPALFQSALWLEGSRPVFIPFIDRNRLSRADETVRVEPEFVPKLLRDAVGARRQFAQTPEAAG
jgi:hypothetical protein